MDEKEIDDENRQDDEGESDDDTNQNQKPSNQDGGSGEIDYEALLAEEKKRRIKAEAIIQRHKERESEGDSDDEDKLRGMIREEVGGVVKTLQEQGVREAIRKIAVNTAEADLIYWHYQNSIIPTGDIDNDIDNARVIANKRQLLSDNKELKLALRSRENKTNVGGGAGQRLPDKKEVKVSPAEQKLINYLKQQGWDISLDIAERIVKGEDPQILIKNGILKKKGS